MHKADVAVIIPLYNRIQYIEHTIRSIQAQTYTYWEAIIVDDGSTDGSVALAEKLVSEDSRIKLLKRERLPKGASVCRNIGLAYTHCQYILFLDSDDLLAPHCLADRLASMKANPHLDFVVYPMLLFGKQIDDLGIVWNIATEEDDLTRFLRMDAVWQTSCPLYTKQILTAIGGFDESLPFLQDYELHVRVLCVKPAYIKKMNVQPDCYWRRHTSESISQKGFKNDQVLLVKQSIFNKIVTQVKENNLHQQYTAVAALLFSLCKEWITFHQAIDESIRCWEPMKSFTSESTYFHAKQYLHQYYSLYASGHKYPEASVELKRIEKWLPESFYTFKSFLYLFKQTELQKISDDSLYPIISVIIPNENNGRDLPQRIENVLGQSFPFTELIIVDNGSTDNSREIIEEYTSQNARICFIYVEEKVSIFRLWQEGISKAKGSYIWIAEPGSYATSDFLLELKKVFRDEYGAVSCKSWIIGEDATVQELWEKEVEPLKKSPETNLFIVNDAYALYRYIIPAASAVLFKKDNFYTTYKSQTDLPTEEWAWANILFSSTLHLSDKILTYLPAHIYTVEDSKLKTGKAMHEISSIAAYYAPKGSILPKLRSKILVTLINDLIIGLSKGAVTVREAMAIYQNLRKLEAKLNNIILKQLIGFLQPNRK